MERMLAAVMPRITRWFPGLIRVLAARGPMPEQARLIERVTAYWISQAISAGAALGVFDHITPNQSIDELAVQLQVVPEALHRLLRALAVAGIVSLDADERPSLTTLGLLLTKSHPSSLQAIAIACGQEWYHGWGQLRHSVITGKSGFEKVYGKRFFEYTRDHPGTRAIFDAGMRGISSMTDLPVALAYNFAKFRRLTDVVGGTGSQLVTVLRLNQRVEGTVFDLPAVVDAARASLSVEPGVAQRVSFDAGDFMQSVPSGSDAYLMKSVLHDWSDEEAVNILKNCRRQMQPGSTLLIAEHVIQPGNTPQFGKLLDLMMLVNLGGKERTRVQYQHLLERASLRLTGEFPTLAQMTLLEASPA